MAKIKITNRDLKEDEVKTFGVKVYLFVKNNSTFLILGISVILVAFIAINVYRNRQRVMIERANNAYTQAYGYYVRGLMSNDVKERQEFLNGAVSQCEAVIRNFPRSPLANQAIFLEGNAYYFLNNFDQAITRFQQYIDRATEPIDRARGYVALGYAFENKFFFNESIRGLLTQAEKAYERAIEEGMDSYIAYEARLCKARLLELRMQYDAAEKAYREVLTDRKLPVLLAEEREEEQRKPIIGSEQQLYEDIKEAFSVFSFSRAAELSLDRLSGERL